MIDKLSPADAKWVAKAREDFIQRVDGKEIAVLRARVTKLEEALGAARPFVNMAVTQGQAEASPRWYEKAVGALAKIDAALKDAPQ